MLMEWQTAWTLMLMEWQTAWTLIRLLLQKQSDLGLHCLLRPICPNASNLYGSLWHTFSVTWDCHEIQLKQWHYIKFRLAFLAKTNQNEPLFQRQIMLQYTSNVRYWTIFFLLCSKMTSLSFLLLSLTTNYAPMFSDFDFEQDPG